MKKFLTICCVLFMTLIAFTSCKDVKPEYKFKLEIAGEVVDTPTNIQGDFSVNVCNDAIAEYDARYVRTAEAEVPSTIMSIAEQEGTETNKWLDNYIQNNVIAELAPTTEYNITVKGYVHEEVSGITFSVDKVFTNKEQ